MHTKPAEGCAGPASIGHLISAFNEARTLRQQVRKEEQDLAAMRSALLLSGTDEQLDAIDERLAQLGRLAERIDERIPAWAEVLQDRFAAEVGALDAGEGQRAQVVHDRKDIAQRLSKAFDAVAPRLRDELRVSDLEIGRALLASGLAKLSTVIPPRQLSIHLIQIAAALVDTGNVHEIRVTQQ